MIARHDTNCGQSTGGFTLIELILVIVIIGILVGVAVQNGGQLFKTARIEETKQEMDALAVAIAGNPELENNGVRSDFGYVGDVGSMPPNLDALYTNPGSYATWNGPYISNRFTQIADDYKTDAFGAGYAYNGGATITSTGSGSNIIRRVANSTDDLIHNNLSGNVVDIDGTPPGPVYDDSVLVRITYPNGTGGNVTEGTITDPGGYFEFDSLPIGNHNLQIIYEPDDDTLRRFVSVAPNSAIHVEYRFDSNFWFYAGGGGGAGSEILRPNGSGSSSQLSNLGCSANWQCVDEATADDNGSYVLGPNFNSWRLDLYAAEDHTVGTGTIDSVVVRIRGREGHPSSRVRTALRTNGSTYYGSSMNPPSSYTDYSTSYGTNPQTSSAWTWSEIDAMEIGVYIRRSTRCTQVWVEVFYAN